MERGIRVDRTRRLGVLHGQGEKLTSSTPGASYRPRAGVTFSPSNSLPSFRRMIWWMRSSHHDGTGHPGRWNSSSWCPEWDKLTSSTPGASYRSRAGVTFSPSNSLPSFRRMIWWMRSSHHDGTGHPGRWNSSSWCPEWDKLTSSTPGASYRSRAGVTFSPSNSLPSFRRMIWWMRSSHHDGTGHPGRWNSSSWCPEWDKLTSSTPGHPTGQGLELLFLLPTACHRFEE